MLPVSSFEQILAAYVKQVLCIGSNLGLKFGPERPITWALTDFCSLTL